MPMVRAFLILTAGPIYAPQMEFGVLNNLVNQPVVQHSSFFNLNRGQGKREFENRVTVSEQPYAFAAHMR